MRSENLKAREKNARREPSVAAIDRSSLLRRRLRGLERCYYDGKCCFWNGKILLRIVEQRERGARGVETFASIDTRVRFVYGLYRSRVVSLLSTCASL